MFPSHSLRALGRRPSAHWLLLFVAFLASAPPIESAEILVDSTNDGILDDNRCTLREAVSSANADAALHGCTAGSGHDTIVLFFDSDHNLTVAGTNEDLNQTGDLDVTDDLTIRPLTGGLVRVDGNILDRIFEVFDGANLTIENLDLRDGETVGFGGCIFVREASSELLLRDTLLSSCQSTLFGGSISSEGPVTLRGSYVNSGQAAFGAGVYMSSPALLTIWRSELFNNYATSDGGAIYASNVLIDSSSIYFNQADRDGAGVFAEGDSALDRFRIVNSTIGQNSSAEDGGGLYVDTAGRVEIYSSTVAHNEADSDANESGDGGGFYVESGVLQTRNSVFGSNSDLSSTGLVPDCFGDVDSQGHNLFSSVGLGCVITGAIASDLAGSVSSPLDPEVSECLEPDEFGTSVMEPFPTSPLLDAGEPSGCQGPSGEVLEMDQSLLERVWDGPDPDSIATCDIGSVEFGAPLAADVFGDGFESGDTSAWSVVAGGLFPPNPAALLTARDHARSLVWSFGGCD